MSLEPPNNPNATPAATRARGEEIFRREGCVKCHVPPTYTSGEMFDPARLLPEYQPKGWNPPGVTTRPVPGHTFGLSLAQDDKAALLAFLRTL